MDEIMSEEMKTETKPKVRKVSAAEMSRLNFRNKRTAKRKPSLYDSNLVDRHYWGNDPGTDLEMGLTRIEISRSLSKGIMLDIKYCRTAVHLGKDSIAELMKYQLHLMTLIADENDCNVFQNVNGDGSVMVDFNSETNQYEFIFIK